MDMNVASGFPGKLLFFVPFGARCSVWCTGEGTNYYMGPIHPRDKKPVGHLAGIFRQALGAWNDWVFIHQIFVMMFKGDISSKPQALFGRGVGIFFGCLEMMFERFGGPIQEVGHIFDTFFFFSFFSGNFTLWGQRTTAMCLIVYVDKADEMYNCITVCLI